MAIYRSPLPDVDVPPVPLTQYVLERAVELGDKPALIDGPTGRTITYAQLDTAVRSLAGGLLAHGLRPGQVVALIAPNIPEYAVVFHGVAGAGAVVTTINPTYTSREINEQLRNSGAVMIVTVSVLLDLAHQAAAGTDVTDIVSIDAPDGSAGDVVALASLFGEPLPTVAWVAPEAVVVLPYSSGTTGAAKGVMLSHRNLVSNVAQTIAVARLREDERLIAVLPFFHIYGMSVLINSALRAGATVVTMPRFDLPQFLQLHADHAITRSFVAPPIVLALAKHPLVDSYDLSALEQVVSGAAPLSGDLAIEASARIGCEVVQGYGMTEMSPVSHFTPPGRFRPGSVGILVPNTEMRVVDPLTGQDVDEGVAGELWVRGPQVMRGYLGNAEATAATLDQEGWLRTGDIVRVDPEGDVYVVDRLKELIKVNAFQVAPAELEGLLLQHPDVADAAVIGMPDPETGEAPIAYVVRRPDAVVTAEELMTHVANQVARYKRLRGVHFIDAVPKSASGKILRRLLSTD